MNTRHFLNPFQVISRSPLLSIILCICIANWQLLFGFSEIKFDSSNYWHPWRYFISECYNNGTVPIWNPFTQAGYPIHGDLQGPAYSIDAILNSFLLKGSVYSISLTYLAYLSFGAYGLYKLSLFIFQNSTLRKDSSPFSANTTGALLAGIIYSLSGYVTVHGHNLYIVISIGVVPWLIYYFFKILNSGSLTDSFKFAIIITFQVTAGNPSFLIVLIYFFFIAFLSRLILKLKQKELSELKKSIRYFFITAICALILCAPVLINALLIFKDSTRSAGISVDWAGLENSTLLSVSTFFSPLSGFENQVDASVRQPILGYYIGVFSLFFAVYGFFKFRSFWLNCLGIFAVVSFLISLGLDIPLFAFLHKYLPLFNVFRMPKLTFIYDIIYLLILFSCGLSWVLEKDVLSKKTIRIEIVFIASGLLLTLIYFVFLYPKEIGVPMDRSSIADIFRTSTQAQKVIVSFIISMILLAVLYFVLIKRKLTTVFFCLLLLDVMFHYNVSAIIKVFSDTKLSYKENYISNLPLQFPVPENTSPVNARGNAKVLQPFWLNSNIYIKQPEFSNANSFALSNYAFLEDLHKPEYEYVINKPRAFLVDSICEKIEINPVSTNKNIAVVNATEIQKLNSLSFQRSTTDTITCSVFQPQHFIYTIANKNAVGFILQQNYNRFWKISVNGKAVTPAIAYYTFPLISLSPGENVIEFSYEIPYFHLLFCISLVVFLILICYLIIKQAHYKKTLLLVTLLLVCYCSTNFVMGRSRLQQSDEVSLEINKKYPNAFSILNTNGHYAKFKTGFNGQYNFVEPEETSNFITILPSITNEYIIINSYKAYFPPELNTVIENLYGKRISTDKDERSFTYVYKKAASTRSVTKEKETTILFEERLIQDSSLIKGIELKKGQEYGQGIKFNISEKKLKKYDLLLLEAEIETDHSDVVGLCLSIDNMGTNKKFISNAPLKTSSKKTRKLCLLYTLAENIKKKDEISVFVWNPSEKPVLLHAMTVRAFRP